MHFWLSEVASVMHSICYYISFWRFLLQRISFLNWFVFWQICFSIKLLVFSLHQIMLPTLYITQNEKKNSTKLWCGKHQEYFCLGSVDRKCFLSSASLCFIWHVFCYKFISQIFSTGARFNLGGFRCFCNPTEIEKGMCPIRKFFVEASIKFHSSLNRKKSDRYCICIMVWI